MSSEGGAGWIAAKAGIVGVAASIVFAGLAAEPGGLPVGLAAILLVPALIFLLGVWSPPRVMVFGGLLVGITAATWILYELHKRESMAAVGIAMGSIWSLFAVLIGSGLELGDRSARKRLPEGSNAYRMEADDPELGRRRAW